LCFYAIGGCHLVAVSVKRFRVGEGAICIVPRRERASPQGPTARAKVKAIDRKPPVD
jgi:hypothetical protein